MSERLHIDPAIVKSEEGALLFNGYPNGSGGEIIAVWITTTAWTAAYDEAYDGGEAMPAVDATAEIERVAQRKFEAKDFAVDGSIIIGEPDLWHC